MLTPLALTKYAFDFPYSISINGIRRGGFAAATKRTLIEWLKMEDGYHWVDTTCDGQVQICSLRSHHLNDGKRAPRIVVQLVHSLYKGAHKIIVE